MRIAALLLQATCVSAALTQCGTNMACDDSTHCCARVCDKNSPYGFSNCYGQPNNNNLLQCHIKSSLRCDLILVKEQVWPFIAIGIGGAVIILGALGPTLYYDAIKTRGEEGVKPEKSRAWGLAVLCWTSLSLIFQIAILASDRSLAEWEVVTYPDNSTTEKLGLGVMRGDDWVMKQIWEDSSCDKVQRLAKVIQAFGIMLLVLTVIQVFILMAAVCTECLAGNSMVGVIGNATLAVFALVLICTWAAWWEEEQCGMDVKAFDGIHPRFAITGWALSCILFLTLGGLFMIKPVEIFGAGEEEEGEGEDNAPDNEEAGEPAGEEKTEQ